MPVDDDDNFVSYGTALDPIEEEEVVRKKPITIQEQIATDENGRRRFHGAFTGGFSAGYFNTVGSKEGWTPSNFKSSRSDRFSTKGQNVTDFMDDEDMGAFGIAPQVLRPTDEFATTTEGKSSGSTRKRPKPTASDGPIPGIPVLHQIIEPVKETIGIKILIRMGWRPGQGVGPRVAKKKVDKSKKKEKPSTDEIAKPTLVEEMEVEDEVPKKSYGCELPPELVQTIRGDDTEDSEDNDLDANVLYAPEDVESPLCNPKENAFGLGYKGLERLTDSVGHIDLFGKPLNFRVEKKTLNITGEAFGIGAFEEPDEDVYNREDMSQYDFELETVEERKKRKIREALEKGKKNQRDNRCIEGFRLAKNPEMQREFYPPPRIPHDFKPVHVSRKSRFDEPAYTETDDGASKRGLGRHALTIQERQVLLGEQSSSTPKPAEADSAAEVVVSTEGASELIAGGSSSVPKAPTVAGTERNDPSVLERVERIKKFVQIIQAHSTKTESNVSSDRPGFKPFMKNPEKQDRYDKYLTLVSAGFQDCLKDIQPLEMTEWEREREKQEFERAAAIYKPLSGVMQSRFVSAKSHDISHLAPEREAVTVKDPTEDPKVAAKMNLFGKLTHTVVEWHPDKLLCKRFNIKDPYPDSKFVGLRGGTSSAKRDSAAVISNQTLQAEASSLSQTKKSLFENLDFTKPPPGLLPVNNAGESGEGNTEPPPPGTLEESQGNSNSGTKILEFQTYKASHEEKENDVPAPPPKPPMDLFKEIFAESSSESESEDPPESKDLNEKGERNEQRSKPHFSGKVISDLRLSERDDRKADRKEGEERRRRRFDDDRQDRRRGEESRRDKETGKTEERKRGIFDKLDLNQFRDKKTPPPSKCESGKEKNESEDEKEDEEEYGPRVPIKVLAGNSLGSSTSKSSQLPNLSSSALNKSVPAMKTLAVKKSTDDEDVVWVEKDALEKSSSSSKSSRRKHSVKKSKKSKKGKSKSSRHKEMKHKKSKKHKSKKKKVKRSSNAGHSDDSSNSTSSEKEITANKKLAKDDKDSSSSSDDSSSSVTIYGSLDQKALLDQLKKITKSH